MAGGPPRVSGQHSGHGPTRYRVVCGVHTLLLDKPRSWAEDRLMLASVRSWRFVIEHAEVHNVPPLLDLSRTTGPIADLLTETEGEPS